eukprot:9577220-Prorocentrum_lima.AAC.1
MAVPQVGPHFAWDEQWKAFVEEAKQWRRSLLLKYKGNAVPSPSPALVSKLNKLAFEWNHRANREAST